MEQTERIYTISGLDCPDCAKTLETGVRKLKGVKSCSLNFTTATLNVSGDASDESIKRKIKELGFDIEWKGKGLQEKGIDRKTGKIIVEVDKRFFRPAEVDILLGDPSKAMKELGWKPKIKFKELAKMMVESDMKMIKEHDERF